MAVRAASVGLGWWGGQLAAASRRSQAVEIVRCFARSPDRRQAFAEEYGGRPAASFEELLEDPEVDALLLATPHSTHTEMIVAAAEAGKHLFVEKPLTLEAAEGRRAAAAAEAAGVVLQVGHHRRRQPGNRRLRQLVEDGDLGVVHLLEATMHVPKYQEPIPGWRADPDESPAGGMTALGVHMVDTFHYLVGATTRVQAYSKRILGRWDVDDATVVGFEFDSGPLGYLGTSLVLPKRCDVAVYGTESVAWSEEEGTRVHRQAKTATTREEEPVEPLDVLADQMREFAACVETGGTPEAGAPQAVAVVEVLEAIVESVRTGRSVDIADVR